MTHCIIVHIYNTVRHECQRQALDCDLIQVNLLAWRYNPPMRRKMVLLLWVLALWSPAAQGVETAQSAPFVVQAGDTWAALAIRYNLSAAELRALNPHQNAGRQPAIGQTLTLPDGVSERMGSLRRPNDGGLVQTAAAAGLSVWALATSNGLTSPYRPTFYQPIFLPGDGTIRDLPLGMTTLELSQAPAAPGMALGVRGTLIVPLPVVAELDALPLATTTANDGRFVGVVGTGAFYAGGEPELVMRVGEGPTWMQPLVFAEREWEYQELTLTGQAAEIDQQARDEERARLREIWTQITPTPQWNGPFATPIADFLQISANYGARRSYNGGPYLTYHEGVDYSAYAGTPVFAPAAGTVVVAEPLYVRGGAVILDHGLGVYTGYYHLSAIHATAGQQVQPGDVLGEVGTTGLSTGNHLHWDMLINGIWVDAALWQEQDLGCWLLAGLGDGCPPPA